MREASPRTKTIFAVARLLMIVLLTVWLAACTLPLQENKAPIKLPKQFSTSGYKPLPEKWWLAFGDETLDKLIDQAMVGNLNLQSAWDRLNQAEAVARRAGADLVPFLSAEVGTSRTRIRENGHTSDLHGYALGLVAGYEVDLWGRIRSSRDAAVLDARASAEDLRAAALTLTAQVASTWYQLVEQYGQLKLLDSQISTNEKVLELVTLQFRTGQVGIADVLQQRQLLESNHGEKTQVDALTKVLEHQLAILLGFPPDQKVAPQTSELRELPPLPATGLPVELIQRRPDLRSAYYSVLSADRNVAAAIADRLPRLSLTAQVDSSGGHTRDLFDNWLASLMANLTGPLFDGGLRKAEVDRTRAAATEALHIYGQAALEAFSEVEDALVLEQRQREFIASLNKQLELAVTVIERLRDRYTKGTVDYQRVLDALLSYQQLQRSLLTAQRELIQDRIALCRSLGGGWELKRSQFTNNLS